MSKAKKRCRQVAVICAYCKKPLGGAELWEQWGRGASTGSASPGNHAICPNCLHRHHPHEYLAIQEERKGRIRDAFKKDFTDLYGHLVK